MEGAVTGGLLWRLAERRHVPSASRNHPATRSEPEVGRWINKGCRWGKPPGTSHSPLKHFHACQSPMDWQHTTPHHESVNIH